MLTFLRKIRKSLIHSGSTRKYLIYALGEIALVVIGILIALQINNWNEKNKARSFELTMLSEVKNSLGRDTAYFNMLTHRITWIDTSSEKLIRLMIDEVNSDSLFLYHLNNISTVYTFMYEDGAYETLKASGIENVSNDSLRNSLINHYGFEMPRWAKLMKFHRKDSDLKMAEDLEWDIFTFRPGVFNGQPWIVKTGLKPNVVGGEALNRYIRIKQSDASKGLSWLKIIAKATDGLLNQLNDELKNSG